MAYAELVVGVLHIKGLVEVMKVNFDIIQNDITNMSVDAIVLPANEKLERRKWCVQSNF